MHALLLLLSFGCLKAAPDASEDLDGDGYSGAEDCDDDDPSAYPGGREVCDGADNDCNGEADEGLLVTYYPDGDGDGYGDMREATQACSLPTGYVTDDSDCDDSATGVYPGAVELVADGVDQDCDGGDVCYVDVDGDGYGTDALVLSEDLSCEGAGRAEAAGDCDDGDARVNPGAQEICNGRDDDCDDLIDDDDASVELPSGGTYYTDDDGDGFGDPESPIPACAAPTDSAQNGADCDDSDASISPAADERCDEVDRDCDGQVDEGDAVDALTWYSDSDNDGYGGEAIQACEQPSGAVTEGGDCDDDDSGASPAALEICDGVDNDCDGVSDEDDAVDATTWYTDSDGDGYGDASAALTACQARSGVVSDATDCDDAEASTNPGANEVCDGVDNDCDGDADEDDAVDAATWYADSDGDGYGDASLTDAACAPPTGYVADDSDCDDAEADINPGASELCDGVDNDCDGSSDEDDAADAGTWYTDSDGDGYGDDASAVTQCVAPSGAVEDGGDCDDADAALNPGALETCDGVDEDCDGTVDNDEAVLGDDPACAAYSCLDIIDTRDDAPADGLYYIDPDVDGSATEVYCDMSTDGGGYTLYKIQESSAVYAPAAERACAALGMQLFIPRTEAHRDAAFDVGEDSSIGPSGGDHYLDMLAIYPNSAGADCQRVQLNSDHCTTWSASDGGPYWVGDATNVRQPNGSNDGSAASMDYSWSAEGALRGYDDKNGSGHLEATYMCDVGDKQ